MWKVWKKKLEEMDEVAEREVPVVVESEVPICEVRGWEAEFIASLIFPPKAREWEGMEVEIIDAERWPCGKGHSLRFSLVNLTTLKSVLQKVEVAAKKIERE